MKVNCPTCEESLSIDEDNVTGGMSLSEVQDGEILRSLVEECKCGEVFVVEMTVTKTIRTRRVERIDD